MHLTRTLLALNALTRPRTIHFHYVARTPYTKCKSFTSVSALLEYGMYIGQCISLTPDPVKTFACRYEVSRTTSRRHSKILECLWKLSVPLLYTRCILCTFFSFRPLWVWQFGNARHCARPLSLSSLSLLFLAARGLDSSVAPSTPRANPLQLPPVYPFLFWA